MPWDAELRVKRVPICVFCVCLWMPVCVKQCTTVPWGEGMGTGMGWGAPVLTAYPKSATGPDQFPCPCSQQSPTRWPLPTTRCGTTPDAPQRTGDRTCPAGEYNETKARSSHGCLHDDKEAPQPPIHFHSRTLDGLKYNLLVIAGVVRGRITATHAVKAPVATVVWVKEDEVRLDTLVSQPVQQMFVSVPKRYVEAPKVPVGLRFTFVRVVCGVVVVVPTCSTRAPGKSEPDGRCKEHIFQADCWRKTRRDGQAPL